MVTGWYVADYSSVRGKSWVDEDLDSTMRNWAQTRGHFRLLFCLDHRRREQNVQGLVKNLLNSLCPQSNSDDSKMILLTNYTMSYLLCVLTRNF